MTSMPPDGPLWKTRQVAEALGLSASTVKRLVDAGEIRAARTSGGHRLIPAEEAFRYAAERKLPPGGLERLLSLSARPPRTEPADETVDPEALVTALRRGRTEEAARLLAAYHAAVGAVALADRLVRPAMQAIGHEWREGVLDVFQEHRATRALESSLMELLARAPRPAAGRASPLAIGCGPEGDPYTVAGLLCELALREQGWDVMNLGPNLPLASLAKAVLAHQPRLVWMTVSHLNDPDRFVRDYASFYGAASKAGAAVILGGQALGSDLRVELAAAGFGERVSHLAELARRLHPDARRRTAPDQDGPAGVPDASR